VPSTFNNAKVSADASAESVFQARMDLTGDLYP
jgi:hypothetical protein